MQTEQEFIDNWKGSLTGEWASSACQVYWAMSYSDKLTPAELSLMSREFLELEPRLINLAPCSCWRARQWFRLNDGVKEA